MGLERFEEEEAVVPTLCEASHNFCRFQGIKFLAVLAEWRGAVFGLVAVDITAAITRFAVGVVVDVGLEIGVDVDLSPAISVGKRVKVFCFEGQ